MVFVNLGPFLIREVSSFKGCPLRGVPLYVCTYTYIPYNWLFIQPRNLCVLAKNVNLWILFMRGSAWGMVYLYRRYKLYLCDFSLIRIIA